MFSKIYTCISKLCGLSHAPNNDWEKQIKDDLEDDNEIFYDAEGGSNHQMIDLNVTMGERVKTIEELYREEVDKLTFKELQLRRCKGCIHMSSAQNIYQDNIIRDLVNTVNKLQNKVDGNQEFDVVKKYHEDQKVLNVLEGLTRNTNEIKNQISSIERNTEKLNTKYGLLKARLVNLEKDSMENSMRIIGMDYSTRTLLWSRPNLQFTENRFGRSQPHYPQQPVAPTTPAAFVPTGSSPTHSISRPPPPPHPGTSAFSSPPSPPPPAVTSAFGPPPPPMTTGTTTAPWNKFQATAAVVSSPPAAAPNATGQKTYSRIVITEDLLKSVVLKPPGQRKAGNRTN